MKLRTHQFGGNFEEIEEREINKMASRTVPITLTVPKWMHGWMKENRLSPSRILQDEVLRLHKQKLDEERIRELVDKQLNEHLQGDGIPRRKLK